MLKIVQVMSKLEMNKTMFTIHSLFISDHIIELLIFIPSKEELRLNCGLGESLHHY